MFEYQRLEKLINDAKRTLTICENMLLEHTINFKFNPTSWNKHTLQNSAERVAEVRNYIETLQAMLEERNPVIDVTPEMAANSVAQLLP